ncbi:hypothetical protein [Priestia endophytica]|jgi:uncharacterized lipoprotein YehR (DUF1307 family)|uniref:hypothetical protein n=1 Tax=Priestia endophytica TaxID=135735 RepID=UPI000F5310E8|nr:hypothetical protein [Priestia endophytica]MED4069799.1 hypothetical protein [Priestia endophytica]RPK14962.1 hypothetical protein FH5_00397 [Priestia endophytica]
MKKTKKMMTGVVASLFTFSMTACSSSDSRPKEPDTDECKDWDWDEETQTYYCDDSSSHRSGYFYYGGRWFSNKSALQQSSGYKSYKNSSKFKSGIGSGTKGSFGG